MDGNTSLTGLQVREVTAWLALLPLTLVEALLRSGPLTSTLSTLTSTVQVGNLGPDLR